MKTQNDTQTNESNDLAEFLRVGSFIPTPGPAMGRTSPIGSVTGQMLSHRAAGASRKKSMVTPLLLTALVDAFSILVIFLLVQVTATQSPIDQNDKMKLPQATVTDGDKNPANGIINISINGKSFVVDGNTLDRKQLAGFLAQKKNSLPNEEVRVIIQADEKTDADFMSPLLLATAEAQISKVEFAVEDLAGHQPQVRK